jgi:hypothetical protein
MNRLPAILIPLVLAMPAMAQSEQPCYFCDSMQPYKHSIMFQFNRAFDEYKDIYDYFTHVSFEDGLPQNYYANLRYGYRVHKNIMVGPELMFFSQKRFFYKKILHVTSFKVGGYARFIVNKWQVFKPYADVGMSYNSVYFKYIWTENYVPTDEEIQWLQSGFLHHFDAYIAPGMSFMIWQNHINIDLGIKFSPFRNNVNSKMFVFTWKIGYNFNSKK